VLRGDHDGVDTDGVVVGVVLDGNLRLAVGAKVAHLAGLSYFGQLLREFMGERDGCRHQLGGFVGGVAEHHALVAGTAGVHTLSDVGGLAVDGRDHSAGVRVEALEGIVIADLVHRVANKGLEVDISLGGDLAGNDDQAGASERFAGNAAVGVLGQAGIENGIRDLVGNLVGVTLGHRLTGEKKTVGRCRQKAVLQMDVVPTILRILGSRAEAALRLVEICAEW
jgi:hypothetical protein